MSASLRMRWRITFDGFIWNVITDICHIPICYRRRQGHDSLNPPRQNYATIYAIYSMLISVSREDFLGRALMVTSSNGNIFRVTCHWCGDFPRTKASDTDIWFFFDVSLICAWINAWVNNGEGGDLRHHRAHYGVTVTVWASRTFCHYSCTTCRSNGDGLIDASDLYG